MTGIYIISVHFDKFKRRVMNKVEVTLSETFRRGSFMTWLLSIENEKKVREKEFENLSKIEQNWEQRGFRKVLCK